MPSNYFFFFKKYWHFGTSLAVQWLRLCAPNAGCPGSIPGQVARSHMVQLKILHATRLLGSQINIKKKKRNIGLLKFINLLGCIMSSFRHVGFSVAACGF